MSLDLYNTKRDFAKTSEPRGESPASVSNSCSGRFVVQEHHASHLHYDFRIEVSGVLKSWAVPKGPPPAKSIKRLAIQTEDHPIEYIAFSGTIPAGNYGAGEMSIWDSGTFDYAAAGTPAEGIEKGKIELILHGARLVGKYDLMRTDDAKRQWLFIKANEPGETSDAARKNQASKALGRSGPMPSLESVQPMLAVTRDAPFTDPDWQFEIKWDGYRALLFCGDGTSRLVSRNQQSFDQAFPELKDLGRCLRAKNAIVDGEIVALAPDGTTRFQPLQNRYGRRHSSRRSLPASSGDDPATIVYMAFDLLYFDGRDVTGLQLEQRRTLLSQIIETGGPIRFSDSVGDGVELFGRLREMGMEGVIAKRKDSAYVSERSENWAKIKVHKTVDVVIAGYTESKAAGRPFAALLVGGYTETSGQLVSVGHIGTGFNQAFMESLLTQMKPLERKTPAFDPVPDVNGAPHWLKPELVCEVKYSEMTTDGHLRHPVFMQLRADKVASECRFATGAVSTPAHDAAAESPLTELLAPDSPINDATIVVNQHRLTLTHLGKRYWQSTGTTKRDLLRYYDSVAEDLLPHLKDRPIVVQRYPDGVEGKSFFQHDMGTKLPSFVRTHPVTENGEIIHYALCDNLESLLYLANLGAVPLHAQNIRVPQPEAPDRVVFDFDPGSDFGATVRAAQGLHSLLDDLGLANYVKTSGANGLHVYIPIKTDYSSDEVVAFARLIGELLQSRMPDTVTVARRIGKRGPKQIYLDCVQNGVGKTVVSPYSVRAQPSPTVSTPLTWDEVTEGLDLDSFTIDSVPERLRALGDLFLPVLTHPQELQSAIEQLSETLAPDKKKGTTT